MGKLGLAIDAGSTRTKVALIAPVQGVDRVLAQVAVPTSTVPDSLRVAISRLEALSGWELQGMIDDGDQAEAVAWTTSATRPLSAVVIASAEKELGPVMTRFLARGYVNVVASGSLRGAKDANEDPVGLLAAQFDGAGFDVVALAAASTRDAGTISALLQSVQVRGRPLALFSGPADVATTLEESLSAKFDFRRLGLGSWQVRDLSDKDLDESLLGARTVPSSPALLNPTGEKEIDVAPAGADATARFLAAPFRASVATFDVGGGSTVVAGAVQNPDLSPPEREPQEWSAHVALGTAGGLRNLLRLVPLREVQAWLPFDVEEERLRDYLANRAFRACTAPHDLRQLMIEQAVARVCGRAACRHELKPDILMASGGIAAYPRLGQTALTLLDMAQPTSPCRILVDQAGLAPRLGPMIRANAEMARSILGSDTFVNAGACLSLIGKAKQGDVVAEIGIQRIGPDGETTGLEDEETYEVRFGGITLIPLGATEKAAIRVSTGRRFTFGIEGQGKAWAAGPSDPSPGGRADGIAGGVLGLIVDARGRPLELSEEPAQRQARLTDWLRTMDAYDAEVFSSLD